MPREFEHRLLFFPTAVVRTPSEASGFLLRDLVVDGFHCRGECRRVVGPAGLVAAWFDHADLCIGISPGVELVVADCFKTATDYSTMSGGFQVIHSFSFECGGVYWRAFRA